MKRLIAISLLLTSVCTRAADTPNVGAPPTNGHGKTALPDSSVYEGEFKNGLFNGKGVLTWRNGNRYDG